MKVDALLTSPSGRVLVQPCFWLQDYIETNGYPATYATTGTAGWRLRAMFDEAGSWTVAIRAQDRDGVNTSSTLTATVTAGYRF